MPGTDLKPEQLASLWYSLTAHGDDADAELIAQAVPRVTMQELDPGFTKRVQGLETVTYLWAIARLKAERQAWIYASIVHTAFRRLNHAEESRQEQRMEKAHEKLVGAMEAHARADAIAMGIDVALDELAKLGRFNADEVRRTVELERYQSTAVWSPGATLPPDPQTVTVVVAALRHQVCT